MNRVYTVLLTVAGEDSSIGSFTTEVDGSRSLSVKTGTSNRSSGQVELVLVRTQDVTNLLNNELLSTSSTSNSRQFQDVEFFVILLGTNGTVSVEGQSNTGEGWFNQSQVTRSQVTGVNQELSTSVNFT